MLRLFCLIFVDPVAAADDNNNDDDDGDNGNKNENDGSKSLAPNNFPPIVRFLNIVLFCKFYIW